MPQSRCTRSSSLPVDEAARRPHSRRQRDQARRGIGLGADLDAQPVARDLLHGDRQGAGRIAHQRGAAVDAHGGAPTLHRGKWLVPEREATLGTIEAGKLADLVVLSDDYFDPMRVPDDAIRKIKSVLTVVDGKVVHNTMN